MHARRFNQRRAGFPNRHRIVVEVRQPQILQQQTAVRVRIRAHPPRPDRRQVGELRLEPARRVEQLLRPIALHPLLENADVLGLVHVAHRHLVTAPVALAELAVDLARARPALRCAQHDHRPLWSPNDSTLARVSPDTLNVVDDAIERRGHRFVHRRWFVAFDEVRRVAITLEQLRELVLRNAREKTRIGDLIAVQMQDRQHATVGCRVQELVAVPAGGERSGLGFTVAHHARDDQVRVVECSTERMRQRVAEFSAFVNRSRRLRCHVARNTARES